jgi:hypothetical protein
METKTRILEQLRCLRFRREGEDMRDYVCEIEEWLNTHSIAEVADLCRRFCTDAAGIAIAIAADKMGLTPEGVQNACDREDTDWSDEQYEDEDGDEEDWE